MITAKSEMIKDLQAIGRMLDTYDPEDLDQAKKMIQQIDEWLNKAKKDLQDAKEEEKLAEVA